MRQSQPSYLFIPPSRAAVDPTAAPPLRTAYRRTAGSLALTAEEEADDGASEASSLGCASEQDSRKGARRGREEASKVACPDREEGASKAQATEEDLARQVDKVVNGPLSRSRCSSPLPLAEAPVTIGAGRCVFASGSFPAR